MMSKLLTRFILFFVVGVLVSASPPLFAEVLNRIVAVVGDDIITEVDVTRALSQRTHLPSLSQEKSIKETSGGKGKEIAKKNARDVALERLIDYALLDQILSKSKIEVTEDDLARAIASVLHQNRMSLED